MASALNREYIQTVKKLITEMESTQVDPLDNYSKIIPQNLTTFTFTQISMHQLRKTLQGMQLTGSSGEDNISICMIKQAQKELEPLLLRLVNRAIQTRTDPAALKMTKIVSIEKTGKPKMTLSAWRPINVVAALSKVIERVLLHQILQHMDSNELIEAQQHGSMRGKSTQTMVTELHDLLVEDWTNKKEGALIVLNQSKAYNCISHNILLRKLEIIGFQPQAIAIMTSFLGQRKQFVQVEGQRSEKLEIGLNSVIQGSMLSCILFLIYILDMPQIFHTEKHSPAQYRDCNQTNLKTFVDDSYLKMYKEDDKTLQETVINTMEKVLKYTRANKLSVNPDKTQIMLQTTDNKTKEELSVILNGKTIRHKSRIMVLGNLLSDTLTWDSHVSTVLIPALKNRIRTLSLVTKYLDKGFRAIYTNSIF